MRARWQFLAAAKLLSFTYPGRDRKEPSAMLASTLLHRFTPLDELHRDVFASSSLSKANLRVRLQRVGSFSGRRDHAQYRSGGFTSRCRVGPSMAGGSNDHKMHWLSELIAETEEDEKPGSSLPIRSTSPSLTPLLQRHTRKIPLPSILISRTSRADLTSWVGCYL